MAEYAIPVPPTITLPIAGRDQVFPVRRVYCVGRNYEKHALEMGNEVADPPVFFQKQADMIVSQGGSIAYPSSTENLHYEAELVVALKSGGTNISEDHATDHIFGYACGIDLTRRDRQAEAKQNGNPWEIAKAFDDSAPCSAITPIETTGAMRKGQISLSVNGNVRQDSNIECMTLNVDALIAALSRDFELSAGDLIFTGTPEGVGALNPGDIVQVQISGLAPLEVTISDAI